MEEEEDKEEKPSHLPHPAFCSHNWPGLQEWGGYQAAKGFWGPWDPNTAEPHNQAVHFQQTVVERTPKTNMQAELGLQAYVYPVNPPPPYPRDACHNNNGGGPAEGVCAEAEQEPHSPTPQVLPPNQGPAFVPEIPPRCRSSARIEYNALDVRRRLRELAREVENINHCYPMASESSTVKVGAYHPDRRLGE